MKDAIGGFFVAVAVIGGALLWTLSNLGSNIAFYVPSATACVAALVMPTTHFLVGYALFFVLSGAVLYGQHLYVISLPSYTGSPGEAIGLAFIALIPLGVGIGAALNIAFRLGWRGWRAAQQRAAGDMRDARA